VTFIFGQLALADSVERLVRQGNSLYNKGKFNDALKDYEQALIDQPQSLEPKFNKANCYFQLDDIAQAIDLYNEVAAESKNMQFVEKAKYNLGNCYFQQGSKQKDSNLQKAMEDMQTAIVCWRGVLDIDPDNQKAAKNIEVARLTIKDILDQLKNQQDPNQPQDPNQSQQQQQQSQQNQQQSQQQQQQGQDPNQAQDPNEQQGSKADPNQSEQQEQEQEQQQQAGEKEKEEQQQKSDRTAQEILDKEQRDKKQRQLLQRAGYEKVEKDW